MNNRVTALVGIGLITVFSLVGLGKPEAVAASASPIAITFPARQLTYTPPGKNVTHLGNTTVPNGEYNVSIEVANNTLYTGNAVMVISGPHEKAAGPATHMVTFVNVGTAKVFQKTAPKPLVVDQGQVAISLAQGVTRGSDKTFDGSIKLTLTPANKPQARAASDSQPKQQVAASSTQTPATLPETGAEGVVFAFTGTTSVGYAAHRFVSKKRR